MARNLEIDSFYCGRCEEVLKRVKPKSIDLILTSPPYSDKRDYGIENAQIPPEDFVEWFKPMARQIKRV